MESGEFQELNAKSDEELISMIYEEHISINAGYTNVGPLIEMGQQLLDHRRATKQADAARALLQATDKQAAAGDALVKATENLVGSTGRLACATWTLAGITFFLMVVAAFQAYAMFRWHP